MLAPEASRLMIRCIAYMTLAACLLHTGWTWLNQPGNPELDQVVLKYSLANGGFIYGVRDNRGGATVGFSYRFYAHNALVDDEDIKRVLIEEHPFLVTKDPNVSIVGQDKKILVSVKGQVYSFSSRTFFKNSDGSGVTPIDVDLVVQTPE
ncbi:hypothetical protein AUC61_00705 [Pseudomonas sp. S25]|uniref:Uncharacterized protein n=1 Tax=Pseudomonas maioricensis TaxID=1766623 RepID=A0ABS9ZCB5_9PSED|nr:hypothetical protein [Pseudomonas sp. S25]MCI8208040.1 hypothetical protein [Pseudomonas sp. S25]